MKKEHMQDIRYLLSIKELLEESTKEQLTEMAYKKLDSERLEKAKKITNETKRAESIGAGLLIQLGLQQICREERPSTKQKDATAHLIQILTVSQIFEILTEPIEPIYEYGKNHKPYFRDIPWYFNLSHSREYVLCVFSQQEVGVDIQYKRSFYQERILHRFFTEEEKRMWEQLPTQGERDAFFYRMWTAKEALGKLTGEGIAKAISVNVTSPKEAKELGVVWEYCDDLPEYAISVCKWKEAKRNKTKELDTK